MKTFSRSSERRRGGRGTEFAQFFVDLFELASFFFFSRYPLDIFNHHQWQPLHFLAMYLYTLFFSRLMLFRILSIREKSNQSTFYSHSRSYAWSSIKALFISPLSSVNDKKRRLCVAKWIAAKPVVIKLNCSRDYGLELSKGYEVSTANSDVDFHNFKSLRG